MALQSRLICARIQTREAELKRLQAESAAELKRLSGAVLVRAFRGGIMSVVKPFGNVNTAAILVIGHDPRLQRSQAGAEVAFFLDYLVRPRPSSRSEARKCDLAQAVRDYVNELADREVPLAELYVTNLCNRFLEHTPGSGTVLIPDDLARRSVERIAQVVAAGHFRVILPMAVQPFYHLCRLGFIDGDSELVMHFVAAARPRASKAKQGIYEQTRSGSFLTVCGQRFHHRDVPVVPIVHVKQWPLKARMVRYVEPMQRAEQHIRATLALG